MNPIQKSFATLLLISFFIVNVIAQTPTPIGIRPQSPEAKGVVEKCDKDEFTAMKTNKPIVEKENEGGKVVYDVTIPIHDAAGNIIATAGLDFKPEPNQTDEQITKRAIQVAKELESKLPSKDKLFDPAG